MLGGSLDGGGDVALSSERDLDKRGKVFSQLQIEIHWL